MHGLTRATLTLIGRPRRVRCCGSRRRSLPGRTCPTRLWARYWRAFGLVAHRRSRDGAVPAARRLDEVGLAAGLGPRVLVGFVPTLIVGGWMLNAAHEPQNYWLGRHVRSWSGDIGIDSVSSTSLGPDGPRDRVRDRTRLRAHVRHDRPAHPAQDESRFPAAVLSRVAHDRGRRQRASGETGAVRLR